MSKGNAKLFGFVALVAAGLASTAFAQGAGSGCIVVKSTAEIEQVVTDAQGRKSTKLVPLATAVPGTEVVYTTTASNNCKQAADKVAINNYVPEHMTYVPSSVFSPGAQVEYSLDGKTFGTAEQLTVQENGVARKARAEEYRFFRWVFQSSLQPGSSAFARFRAVLN
jgi:uncharacterized repeat protein (TIGR01451 family)